MSDKWDDVIEREKRKAAASPEQRFLTAHTVEGEAALPGPDDPYKAVASISNGREEVLCIIMDRQARDDGEKVYRFFQYMHMASDTGLAFAADGGHIMELRFVGPEPVTIIVRGSDLLRACHLIHRHRIAWIRLFDPGRNFPRPETDGGKKSEHITRIDIIHDDPRPKPGEREKAARAMEPRA